MTLSVRSEWGSRRRHKRRLQSSLDQWCGRDLDSYHDTTPSAVPNALSLTITGTAGSSISHTASTTLLVHLSAPASLTATASVGQISVSWPASVGATSYHVKRALSSGSPYITIGCTTATSLTDTAVTSGTVYYYVVSAAYQAGPKLAAKAPTRLRQVPARCSPQFRRRTLAIPPATREVA